MASALEQKPRRAAGLLWHSHSPALVPTTVSPDLLETGSSEMVKLVGLRPWERAGFLAEKGRAS